MLDPLLIYYVLAFNDDPLEMTSPFQGFGRSFSSLRWALGALTGLPADVTENAHDLNEIIAQRMGGMRQLAWRPLMASALEALEAIDLGIFLVIFSGEAEVADRVAVWVKRQTAPVLHVSSVDKTDAVAAEDFNDQVLRAYCVKSLAAAGPKLSRSRRETATKTLDDWGDRSKRIELELEEHGHNISRPNYMSLWRAGRMPKPGGAYIAHSEDEYTDVILESARAVDNIRDQVGLRSYHAMSLLRPAVILTEPAPTTAMLIAGLARRLALTRRPLVAW